MSYALYIIAGLIAINGLLAILAIGEPRKPITPRGAALIVAVDAAIVAVLVAAALKLS